MPLVRNVVLSAACVFTTVSIASAQVPDYNKFELFVRSNLCANKGPQGTPVFNLPCDSSFNSATPSINSGGKVAVKLSFVANNGGGQGFWYGDKNGGTTVYAAAGGSFIGDVSINAAGDVGFDQSFGAENGIWMYDESAGTSARLTTAPLGASSWGSVTLNDSGEFGYRPSFSGSGQVWGSYSGGSFTVHIADVGVQVGSPYSFLFTPAFNNNRQIAGKVRLGGPGQTGNERPDQIRIFEANGSSSLIAEDVNSNPLSPYSAFDNSVSLTNNGWVAFNANLVIGGRGVFLSNGTTTHTIATTADAMLSDLEFFKPSANVDGLVAFRGKDGTGLFAVFVGDGTTLRRVIGKLDTVETDLGTAQINQHDSSVTFGGGPSINEYGAVVMNAALTPNGNNQIEWGSGIIVAGILGDLTGDLTVNVFDLFVLLSNWNTSGDGAELAAPFNLVDVFDLFVLLAQWSP